MLEYLKRSLAGRTGAVAAKAISRSAASSGNGADELPVVAVAAVARHAACVRRAARRTVRSPSGEPAR